MVTVSYRRHKVAHSHLSFFIPHLFTGLSNCTRIRKKFTTTGFFVEKSSFSVLKANHDLLIFLSLFPFGLHFAIPMNLLAQSLCGHTTVFSSVFCKNGTEMMFMTHCTPQQKTAWETIVSQIHIGCHFLRCKGRAFLGINQTK